MPPLFYILIFAKIIKKNKYRKIKPSWNVFNWVVKT